MMLSIMGGLGRLRQAFWSILCSLFARQKDNIMRSLLIGLVIQGIQVDLCCHIAHRGDAALLQVCASRHKLLSCRDLCMHSLMPKMRQSGMCSTP